MKKILILLTILFCPINAFAYSNYVVCGGNSLGIKVETDGIMVIGFYKIDGKYNKSSIKAGDYIIKINNEIVNNITDMTNIIEKSIDDKEVEIEYIRNGKKNKTILPLVYSDEKYKTGLYVKDSIKGIGTLSYIDPETRIYGALGHEIIESNTGSVVEIKTGTIFNSQITGIEKSTPGTPGSKIAKFDENIIYGDVYKNTKYGIFGMYDGDFNEDNLYEISDDVKVGKAILKTVIEGEKEEDFDIEIFSINKNSETKNLTVKITDERLLKLSGGVVQGMSGSPILQDNKIVGVLTHVIVDNPITGYGIFITTMLKEGENN